MRTDLSSRSRRAPGHRGTSPRRWRAATAGVGVLALVLSACGALGIGDDDADAGSASGDQVATVGVPTVLVMDSSASMLTDDAPGPRIDAAKAAARGLIAALPGEAVLGLVTYGTSTDDAPESQEAGCRDVTTLAQPAELDADGHRETLVAEVDGLVPQGYTPIAESLRQAAGMLPSGDTAIIVISDGEDSCGDPPCEAATELKEQNPGLRISTVGFKTATPELSCIASRTEGLFVTADDADQLTSRLLAAREVDQNAAVLTPTGLGGIDIGAHFNDIRTAHGDFPEQSDGVSEGEYTVITYVDCDYVFDSGGVVVEIRPHGGRTVDGLAVGDSMNRAVELYGEEVDAPADAGDSGEGVRYFTASREAGTAWKISTDGDRITGLVLCRCLPGTGQQAKVDKGGSEKSTMTTTMSGDTEIVTYRPYLDDGSLAPGFKTHDEEQFPWLCGPSPEGFQTCGQAHTGMAVDFCSTDGETVWCPQFQGAGLPRFVRAPYGGVSGNSYSPRPAVGPIPAHVDLTNGRSCPFMIVPGNPRSDAEHYYSCNDYELLWAENGSGVFTTDGTWTSLKSEMGTGPFETVQVERAIFVEK